MIRLSVLTLLMCVMVASEARQFRQLAPISVAPEVLEREAPGQVMASGYQVMGGATASAMETVIPMRPLDPNVIEEALGDILASWNQNGLDDYLDAYFPGRNLLLTVIAQQVPTDAQLDLLSVQNIQTLSQHWAEPVAIYRRQRMSRVVATVNLQLRFEDPIRGQILLPHSARFYLQVLESE